MPQMIDQLERRIMEALDGGTSVAGLAESLGITDARVLWHLEHLVATGYVHGDCADADWRRTTAVEAALRNSVPKPRNTYQHG